MTECDKLRWRCRRGTLELDLMLIRYLDCRYVHAQSDERLAFQDLLATEDSELQGYLLGDRLAESPSLASVITIIRQLPAAPNQT